MLFDEKITRDNNEYTWTKQFIDAAHENFWTADEFEFTADIGQFKSQMTKKEQGVITRALSAIGQIEIAVKTFWANLGLNIPHPHIADLGMVLAHQEVIHNDAYERLLRELGMEHVFQENLKNPIIKGRVDYLSKHSKRVFTDDKKQYLLSLILFTIFVERTSLFSQFYTISNFYKNRALLKDTAQQILYTRNEEALHALVGIKLVNTIREEYPELFDEELLQQVADNVHQAIQIENTVIDWIIEDYEDTDLSAPILKAFIKECINDGLRSMGFGVVEISEDEKALLKHTKWFEVSQAGVIQTDFFAQRATEYSKHYRDFSSEPLF